MATRERGEKKGDEPRSSTKSHCHQTGGALRNSDGGPPARANAPSISIEPNTSLELTEEMVHGRSEVMTRDTLFAKASGSDKHETGVREGMVCVYVHDCVCVCTCRRSMTVHY